MKSHLKISRDIQTTFAFTQKAPECNRNKARNMVSSSDTQADSSHPMSEPLLTDEEPQRFDDRVPEEFLQYGVWLSTVMGATLGFLAPFIALGVATVVSITKFPHLNVDIPFNVVWTILVLLAVYVSQLLLQKTIIRRSRQEGVTEEALELVKLRFGLGALVGLLLSWALSCLVIGFSFWDKIGLISGGVIVFMYTETRAMRICEEDYRVQRVNDPIVGVVVV